MSRELDAFLHFLFLITAILCWIYRGPLKTRFTELSGLFLIVTFVFDAVAVMIMLKKYMVSNLFLYHILTPMQFAIIISMYNSVIKQPLYNKIARWVILVFILASALISLTIQP